jgi:hypothetical protein
VVRFARVENLQTCGRERGTGQIRRKVKEDEIRIGIAGAKKIEFGGG